MTKSGHFGDAELDELHDVIDGGREEGACLTGHLADFKKRRNQVSCNYRWQCYEGNQADSSITERLERYKDVEHKARYRTDLRVTKTTDWLLKYCFFVPAPEEGDWDIGGPSKDLKRRTFAGTKTKIPAGENFTSALWPYYNNAHHIIPKGTLKSEIAATNVSDIVQKGLLKAKYNINHAKNMIFLPMDKRIGQILHLPRHLEFRGKMSHPTYDTYSAAEPVAGGKT
ncbi:MAG: AHH domain-containing protein, partial [Planctomycetota bacterium]